MDRSTLLIVEDEQLIALNLSLDLQDSGYEICAMASSEQEAFELAQAHRPDLVLMDINLGAGGDGINAARRIGQDLHIPVIYLTAYTSDDLIRRTGLTAPYGYIVKPYNSRELKASIETALARHRYEKITERSEKRLQAAVRAAQLSLLEYDAEHNTVQLEGVFGDRLQIGKTGVELEANAFFSRLADEEAPELQQLLRDGRSISRTFRLRATQDIQTPRWIELYLSDMTLEEGRIRIGAIKDVSERESFVNELRTASKILANIDESVIVLYSDMTIRSVNQAFFRQTHFRADEIVGEPVFRVLSGNRQQDLHSPDDKQALNQRREVLVHRQDGSHFHALQNISRIPATAHHPELFIMILTDISGLKTAQRELNRMAYRDGLTGLGNRNMMNQVLAELDCNSQTGAALYFIDIDSFKLINDSMGHDPGDQLLVTFAQRLIQIIRSEDVLIRLGGDEFVIIVQGIENRQGFEHLAQKVIGICRQPFQVAGREMMVTCSIGVAIADETVEDAAALLKHADAAMYASKRKGKFTYTFYSEEMVEGARYRLFIEQGLHKALSDKAIQAYWQPIVDAHSHRVVGIEALCRWIDKDAGMIPPDSFIPVAEETGLIQALGLHMLREACMLLKLLEREGLEEIEVAVNVSGQQLKDSQFLEALQEILEDTQIQPQRLELEVTESTLQSEQASLLIWQLRQAGVSIAIDDFGTGYSSLSKLTQMSISKLKIDRSFVSGLGEDSRQQIVVEAIINLGRSLGLRMTAEGIETIEQRDYLRDKGVHNMQGYYFARPMPLTELLAYLLEQRPQSSG
ncbi:two-component system response regulator [Bowmanella dokdonensis]|uniref:EAL domain-containing protein n=1 Tax=Bowmanella dokdonensis TaxID=751969 RepID=A0A939INI7_9ALTE|nr:EAL domain-containing protein [Bowmanella dokdonensis]MBN7824865.1 EAL domain-containing protein [Bowmanella dokdonensis]